MLRDDGSHTAWGHRFHLRWLLSCSILRLALLGREVVTQYVPLRYLLIIIAARRIVLVSFSV